MADRRILAPLAVLGRKFTPGRPTCIVIHSLEAPATKGMVNSLATGWLQTAPVSVHALAGPDEVIDMVPIDTVAYHCGGGNFTSVGIEHTGYAAWTFAQWISGDSHQGAQSGAFDALRNGARKVAEWCVALNIPIRWLTPDEAAKGARGLITHDTARLAFGGTTHTDPGPLFPYAIYLRMVQDFAGQARQPDPTNQAPGDQVGGAEGDWFDMATKQDLVDALTEVSNSQGYTGAADVGALAPQWEPLVRRWVNEELTKVSISQGFAGAADTSRIVRALRDAGLLAADVTDDRIRTVIAAAVAA